MIRKIFFCALFFVLPLHGIIITAHKFTRELPNGDTQTIHLFGDWHSKNSAASERQVNLLVKMGKTLGITHTAFIVEDCALDQHEYNACESVLKGITDYLRTHAFDVTNVEFRNTGTLDIDTHFNEVVLAQHKKLLEYHDSPEATAYYHALYEHAEKSLIPWCTQLRAPGVCTYQEMPLLIKLLDAKIIHMIHQFPDKKNIVVCVGAGHAMNVSALLKKFGFCLQREISSPELHALNQLCILTIMRNKDSKRILERIKGFVTKFTDSLCSHQRNLLEVLRLSEPHKDHA